jgi:formyltetrahydrofolate-dependent phosphoribosylglycinamide formyltransferase
MISAVFNSLPMTSAALYCMSAPPLRLAVLVSGSGTTLQNLIDEVAAGRLNASIQIVIGSRPGLVGLERAAAAKIANFVVDRKSFDSCEAFSQQVFGLIDDANVDLVCLAGWLCLLELPAKYLGRIMNIHPALLPGFGGKGMFGPRVHQAVLDHGCKVSGCTVHFVDGAYDSGPIIIQRTCPVLDDDTAETLAHRVFEEERIAYPEAIRLFQAGRLKIEGRRVRIAPSV